MSDMSTPNSNRGLTAAENNRMKLPKEMMDGFADVDPLLLDMHPRMLKACYLYLSGCYTYKQIGELIGESKRTVERLLSSPKCQTLIKAVQAQELSLVKSNIVLGTKKAYDTMMDLMENSPVDNVRYQAAKDMLDRAGLKAESKSKVTKTVVNVDKQMEDLAAILLDEDDYTVIE